VKKEDFDFQYKSFFFILRADAFVQRQQNEEMTHNTLLSELISANLLMKYFHHHRPSFNLMRTEGEKKETREKFLC
jgi:hypothetical protein